MSPTNENKNQVNNVNIQDKILALDQIKNGISKEIIAKNFNVHIRTVRNWVKNEKRLREWNKQHETGQFQKRKRMIISLNYKIDTALIIWYHQHRLAGIPINGNILKIQALTFWKIFGGTKDFKASDGWLTRWKNQFGIKNATIGGDKLSSDSEGAENFKTKFMEVIEREELAPYAVFNCDETRLNWKQMPRKALDSSEMTSSSPGSTIQKDRLTVMACSNVTGSLKLPLVVIGKSSNPRMLEDIRNKLPVVYYSQTCSWMTTVIFEDWFNEYFVPTVEEFLNSKGLPAKAVLFMDNCTLNRENLRVRDIKVYFLPPNTTPLTQPMDQTCLQILKSKYRIYLMNFLIDLFQSGGNLPSALKQLSIRKVIYWLHYSWNSIEPTTITKIRKELWPDVEKIVGFCEKIIQKQSQANSNVEDLVPEFHDYLKKHKDFQDLTMDMVNDWAHCAQLLSEEEFLTDSEIVQCVSEEFDGPIFIKDEDEDEDKSDSNVFIDYQERRKEKEEKISEIKNHLDKIIDHCQDNPHYDMQILHYLNTIKDAVELESMTVKSF